MEPEKDIFDQWSEERDSKNWISRKLSYIAIMWNNEWRYIPQVVKQGVGNLHYWFKVIWRDRNYDANYIFEIIQHKLKSQSQYIGGRDRHTRAQHDARNMMICVSIIQKLKDDYYQMEYHDYVKTKHWFEPCEDNEGYSSWESKIVEENFNDYFTKYPLVYKRVMNGEGPFNFDGKDSNGINLRIAMNIAHINHKRAKKLLFNIMEQNIEGWWD